MLEDDRVTNSFIDVSHASSVDRRKPPLTIGLRRDRHESVLHLNKLLTGTCRAPQAGLSWSAFYCRDLDAGSSQSASGTGSGRRLCSIYSRKSLTTGHGRMKARMLSAFPWASSVTSIAIWIRLPSMAPSNVTMYLPSGLWNSSTFWGIPRQVNAV